MTKLKGLGKGLDALLGVSGVSLNPDLTLSRAKEHTQQPTLQLLAIESIQAGKYQPRKIFIEEDLLELAASIKQSGIIQPIIVRKSLYGNYELLAGERRWRASKLAGLTEIPALVREINDEDALVLSLIENIQRKDLNIVEEAEGYRRLVDEFGLTHEALATITGKSRSNISNTLRLLNLHPEVLQILIERKLDMGHARALLPLCHERQLILAEEIIKHSMTTSEVENKVALILHEQKYGIIFGRKEEKIAKDNEVIQLEKLLADKLGLLVTINRNRSGAGKLTIKYSSLAELEAILAKLD